MNDTDQPDRKPTILIADRERSVMDRLIGGWGMLQSEIDIAKDIRPHLTYDPTDGDRVTLLHSGREVPFGDDKLTAELAERIKQRRAGDPGERLVQEVARVHGREKAEHFRHCYRWDSEQQAYVFRPRIGHAPPAVFSDMEAGLQYAVPQVLRALELERRQQEWQDESSQIAELAKEKRQRRGHGGPDYGVF